MRTDLVRQDSQKPELDPHPASWDSYPFEMAWLGIWPGGPSGRTSYATAASSTTPSARSGSSKSALTFWFLLIVSFLLAVRRRLLGGPRLDLRGLPGQVGTASETCSGVRPHTDLDNRTVDGSPSGLCIGLQLAYDAHPTRGHRRHGPSFGVHEPRRNLCGRGSAAPQFRSCRRRFRSASSVVSVAWSKLALLLQRRSTRRSRRGPNAPRPFVPRCVCRDHGVRWRS